MTNKDTTILTIVKVLFWVAFIGLCIQTGAVIVSFTVSLFVNPIAAKDLYMGLNLSEVRQFSEWQYQHLSLMYIVILGLKAYMLFLIIKLFEHFNLSKPFHDQAAKYLHTVCYTALGAGITALIANAESDWLIKRGVTVPIDWSEGELLFFAGVIYLLAKVFEHGAQLQSDNDLTV